MAWIESHQEMARHPKTRRVAVRLGISKAAVIGHLHLLWWWTLDFAPDGDLSGFDAEEVAAVAEWEGDAEQFLQALLDTGWLDEGRRVHNWGDYAGRLVNLRDGIRERQRRFREKKRDVPPSRGDVVAGVLPSQGANVAAMSEAFPDDVTEVSQPCNGGVTVTSPLRNADVTVMSPLRNATQNSTVQNQTEQNRTQPNRERVARGRAGGPAERSTGVPSLSRSLDFGSEGKPAPAGGGHSGGADNAFPPEPEDARRERREPGPEDGRGVSRGEEGLGGSRALLRDGEVSVTDAGLVRADSVSVEGNASGEAGRFSPEAGRPLRGTGNAIPPDSGDLRERREPGREGSRGEPARADSWPRAAGVDEREAFRGEVRSIGSGKLLQDGGASFADTSPDEGPGGADAVSARSGAGSLPEAACGDAGSAARRGKSPLLGGREPAAPEGGEFSPGDGLVSNGAGSLPAGGEASAANRRGEPRGGEQPLRGEFSHDEGPVATGGDSSRDDDRRLLARGEESWNEGGVVSGADADSPPAMADASFDAERLSLQIRESLLAGAASPEDGGSSRSGAAVSSGEGEAIRSARALSSGRGEPVADGAGVSRDGGGSRPKVAALRVEGEDFSPAGGAAVGVASAGGALPGGESFAGGGGNAPPMGEEAREALRQDGAFREAWRGWRLHLADLGRPLMSRGQERALLRECARRGPARAVEVISYSITKGAKNLIWDDAPRARRPQQSAAAKGRAPNPEGWPEWLAEEYPDRAGIDYADAPESVQGEFRRALQKTG